MTILDPAVRTFIVEIVNRAIAEPPSFVSRQVREARRFYLNLSPPAGHRLTVVCGGWECCAPDFRVERADFPFLCVEFVAGGSGKVILNGKEWPLRRGSIFSYGPGCPHRIEADEQDPPLKYFVDFSGREGLDLLRQAGLLPGSCRIAANAEELEEAFEHLLATGRKAGPQAERIAALQAEIILLNLAESAPAEGGREQSFQTYLKCRRCIEERFLEFATATEIAEACHVSTAYLSRLFALHGHESPYHLLLRCRMSHAAALLDGGDRIVREVAEELRLDPFHFSRVFKRIHGVSPADFLRRRRGP
ncbi:AraC family transcriptional regulator [Luteolibacter luteus]|uniref:AraC family transcriptional regulator n=1 Tax=Luteolibacter luteus TaxID=2728835 RepID=A0A858RKV0_9BACT|nr:AraC family transcriptional regulator [Luteolibacter luteus]QJE96820.1 AraC family transcriptional regulator [Luteolibacter luteus]